MPKSTPKSAQDIYEDAQKLSEDQRELLIAMLNSDFSADWASPEIKQAWMEEIRRRIKLLKNGEMTTVPAEEVHQRLRARLDRIGK